MENRLEVRPRWLRGFDDEDVEIDVVDLVETLRSGSGNLAPLRTSALARKFPGLGGGGMVVSCLWQVTRIRNREQGASAGAPKKVVSLSVFFAEILREWVILFALLHRL